MGSTGEPDRKRQLSSSFVPGAAAVAPAKRPALPPCSDDKKLDFAVLKYRNQKLLEQLEVHKFEYRVLEGKFDDLKQRQKAHNEILELVNKSWEHLVRDLEVTSVCKSESQNSACSTGHSNVSTDGACISQDTDFLSRLVETGATESSGCHLENHVPPVQSSTADVLQNVLVSSNDSWHANKFSLALFSALRKNEISRQLRITANELSLELNDAIQALSDLHLKHRQLTQNYHNQRYSNARSKAEQKHLKEELTSTVAELEESNYKLAVLKAQRDTTHGTPILFPTLGNKSAPGCPGDSVRDKQKELQNLEASHKEFTDLISKRLAEIKRLHEERIEILNKLPTFQNTLTDFKSISSSKPFQVLNDQLQKSQAELDHCQTLLEKLQVDKDKLIWQERETNVKVDMAEIPHRVSAHCESSIADLEQNLRKIADEKNTLVLKLKESSREPGRNQIISEFKALVSSLPREMGVMQSEQSKYKDDASKLHSLRAEVHSLSDILTRKEHAIDASLRRSVRAGSEMKDLQSRVCDLRQTNSEFKLFAEMYKRESTDSRDVLECKDRECYEWARVQSLKSSLDESRLEQRVKIANEAEAVSQQRLANAEAEIAELRHKTESSRRDIGCLSELLKSKHEEGEAYLSEIESIGQAYEDIQTQNQQLLQQIFERDDHNTKIFMEGVKVKQAQGALHLEVRTLHRNLQQANNMMDLYDEKIAHLEDKLKVWSEQVGRLAEDGWRHSVSLSNAQRKLVDVQGEAQQLRQSMDQIQAKVGRSRLEVAELLIESEKERFSKRRIEDDLELMSRKASSLRVKTEGLAVLEKLHQEVKEYRGILKCGLCRDRQKEVVIAKCYHLFCNECIQKSLRNRQRRCPSCGLSFGANDVKPIYI